MPAVLETAGHTIRLKSGMTVYPAGVRRHRLFLRTKEGNEIGYLSFPDDRLYYVIVPLFEQKRVQVKIRLEERERVQKVILWVYLPDETTGYPENLQLMIERLLSEYI